MTFYDSLFILQLGFFMVITFSQFYNVLTLFTKRLPTIEQENPNFYPYDIKLSFISFALSLLLYGLGFVISMYQFNTEIFMTLLFYERFILLLNVLFFLIEIIALVASTAQVAIKSYQSKPR